MNIKNVLRFLVYLIPNSIIYSLQAVLVEEDVVATILDVLVEGVVVATICSSLIHIYIRNPNIFFTPNQAAMQQSNGTQYSLCDNIYPWLTGMW